MPQADGVRVMNVAARTSNCAASELFGRALDNAFLGRQLGNAVVAQLRRVLATSLRVGTNVVSGHCHRQ